MIEAILFDCDGVLFHSERANIAFFNEVLARIGRKPLDAEGERMARSMAGPQLVEALFAGDADAIAQARAAAQALDYGPFYRWMDPVPALYPTLTRLREGYRLAMATNRGTTVQGVLERFDLARFFDVAVGTLDVEHPKPAPDMLIKCLRHFDLAPAQALYVGDSPSDHVAAVSAGMPFVAVGDGVDAQHRLDSIADLPKWLAAQPL